MMTDNQKGWLLLGTGAVGGLVTWLLIRKPFSFIYGISAIPLVWGRIILNTKPEERQARPFLKALGIILIAMFVGMTIVGTVVEIANWSR